jgi:hypothetical protein
MALGEEPHYVRLLVLDPLSEDIDLRTFAALLTKQGMEQNVVTPW